MASLAPLRQAAQRTLRCPPKAGPPQAEATPEFSEHEIVNEPLSYLLQLEQLEAEQQPHFEPEELVAGAPLSSLARRW